MDYRSNLYDRYHSTLDPDRPSRDQQLWETRRAAERFLKPFLPADRNAKILELACGTGLLVDHLQQQGYTAIEAIDRSPEQVDIARSSGLECVRCEDADTCLSDKEQCYDMVIAIDLLEHLTKDEVVSLLTAVAKALTPGGGLYIRLPNGAAVLGHTMQTSDFTHETAFTPRSLAQALASCGLSVVRFVECGPIPDRPASVCRWLLWKAWCALQRLVWLIDTGSSGPPVLSPNMACYATLTATGAAAATEHGGSSGQERQ